MQAMNDANRAGIQEVPGTPGRGGPALCNLSVFNTFAGVWPLQIMPVPQRAYPDSMPLAISSGASATLPQPSRFVLPACCGTRLPSDCRRAGGKARADLLAGCCSPSAHLLVSSLTNQMTRLARPSSDRDPGQPGCEVDLHGDATCERMYQDTVLLANCGNPSVQRCPRLKA